MKNQRLTQNWKKTELLKNREYKKLQREKNPKEFKEKQNFWKKKSRESARKADIEEEREKQNDWKARSRTNAREKDYNKTTKVQKENTAKWREKRKSEDAELYKARQQLWRAKFIRVDKFKHLSKNLKKNIGVLVEGWDCDDEENDNDNDDKNDKEKMKKENKRNQRKWETFITYKYKMPYKFIDEEDWRHTLRWR